MKEIKATVYINAIPRSCVDPEDGSAYFLYTSTYESPATVYSKEVSLPVPSDKEITKALLRTHEKALSSLEEEHVEKINELHKERESVLKIAREVNAQ